MENGWGRVIVSVITAIIGVSIISVIVSKNANTTGVIQSAGNAFSNILGQALTPVTGSGSFSSSLSNLSNLGTNLNSILPI